MQQLTSASHSTPADKTKSQRAPMYDLPSQFPREPGLPDVFHDLQPELLSLTLQLTQYGAQERFTGTDLNLYYDPEHRLWHKRPDWFLAVGVPLLYDGTDLRDSYVAWDEKETNPSLIIELLSPGTAQQDLGPFFRRENDPDPETEPAPEIDHYLAASEAANGGSAQTVSPPDKWVVYQDILRVPNYIVFDRRSQELWFFQLVDGRYERQSVDAVNPRLWIEDLGIGLGLWQGEYRNINRAWLRWFDGEDDWLLTPEERERQEKLQERQRADEQEQRADEAERRTQALWERLRQQGIDVDLENL